MRGITSSHHKGHGFREKWRIRGVFTISLPESEWNVMIKSDSFSPCFPFLPSFFSLSHVWISSRKYMEALRAACSLIGIMKEASLRTRTTHRGRQTQRIAEEKCHSPLDHVDIWIKPTLPLGFTDTCASKFWYHSSLCDWNFLFETKRHLSDTAI